MFEAVLGGVDPDDGEASVAVGVVKLGDVLARPLTINAGIGPKVDEHHPAVLRARRPVGVDPVLQSCKLGSRTAVVEDGGVGSSTSIELACAQRIRSKVGVLKTLRQTRRPIRQRSLNRRRRIERKREREHEHDHTNRAPMTLDHINLLTDFVARECEDKQRQRGPQRESHSEQHRIPPNLTRTPRNRHRSKHRTSTRNVHRAERQPDNKTTLLSRILLKLVGARDRVERLLHNVSHLRENHAQTNETQQNNPRPPQHRRRQMQRVQQQRTQQRNHRKTNGQTSNYMRRLTANTDTERHRQHRQNTRRQRRNHPSNEPHKNNTEHRSLLTLSPLS